MTEETLAAQIQLRAYEIWLSEGCPPGRDRIHWVRAEAEFREKLATKSASCLTGLHEKPASVRFGPLPGSDRQLNSS
jgi:hypothetical protein